MPTYAVPGPGPGPEPELPPVPVSAVLGRTFASSNFKREYDTTQAPAGVGNLFATLQDLLRAHCETQDIRYRNDEGLRFFEGLQAEAHVNAGELAGEGGGICQATQRMWTSTLQLRGREFSSILNAAVRDDTLELAPPAADMARAINQLCVNAGRQSSTRQHPPNNVCYRGGGFDDSYRDFFAVGRVFRQPAYVATSFSSGTADVFMRRSPLPSKILWRIYIDPERKCNHVNLVTKRVPGLPDEQEYLFAPYSVFTVLRAEWRAGTADDPHQVDLLAAVDNCGPSEELPLAPWS